MSMQHVGHSQQHAPVKLLKAFQASGTQVCTKADYQGISDSSLSICQSLHRGVSQTFGRGKKQQNEPLLHIMQESKQQKKGFHGNVHGNFFGCAWKKREYYRTLNE